MNRALIDNIARAVLYEGYVLYPYRPSALKNSQRWTFGILYPPAWTAERAGSDRSHCRVECIVTGAESMRLSVLIKFLQLASAGSGLERQEGVEREVAINTSLAALRNATRRESFAFDGGDMDGRKLAPIEGIIELSAGEVAANVSHLRITLRNTAAFDGEDAKAALVQSLASAHIVIAAAGGEFVSATDPQEEFCSLVSNCVNEGVWPVLIGQSGVRDTMLAAPIILPDYPQIAPESAGDLCDATEIEEILTLRVLTLTDEEKTEIRNSDERARAILERAEALPGEHLMRLHGTIRGLAPAGREPWSAWDSWAGAAPAQTVRIAGTELEPGDRVRLHPQKRSDIFDSALEGKIAIIEAIEEDFERNIHLAVVIEDDPGRDLGEMRQIGHRFFFSLAEVEPLGTA